MLVVAYCAAAIAKGLAALARTLGQGGKITKGNFVAVFPLRGLDTNGARPYGAGRFSFTIHWFAISVSSA